MVTAQEQVITAVVAQVATAEPKAKPRDIAEAVIEHLTEQFLTEPPVIVKSKVLQSQHYLP